MKALLYFCMMLFTPLVFAADAPPALSTVKGEVIEVRDVANYTYLHLKTRDGDAWAAVGKAVVKKGSDVTIENAMVMHDFKSPSLKKTFKAIYFGNLADAPVASRSVKSDDAVKITKASGENAYTVGEIMTHGADLKEKQVLVRGKVVKYNAQIMGKNWLHLRDGTGSGENNDLLVTTSAQAKVGDIVTVKGVVRTDKDFGAGYSYKVLVEDATLQP